MAPNQRRDASRESTAVIPGNDEPATLNFNKLLGNVLADTAAMAVGIHIRVATQADAPLLLYDVPALSLLRAAAARRRASRAAIDRRGLSASATRRRDYSDRRYGDSELRRHGSFLDYHATRKSHDCAADRDFVVEGRGWRMECPASAATNADLLWGPAAVLNVQPILARSHRLERITSIHPAEGRRSVQRNRVRLIGAVRPEDVKGAEP